MRSGNWLFFVPLAASGCLLVLDYGDYHDAGGPGGAGTSAGSGGAGIGGGCEPFATVDCYGGPPGTLELGVCRAGSMSCAADGSGFGACEGEITPSPERCADGLDEDCDGTLCAGLLWVARYGDPDPQHLLALEAAQSRLVLGGAFEGVLDFGTGEPLVRGAPGQSSFVAVLDPVGRPLWAVSSLDETRSERTLAVAAEFGAGIYAAGEVAGPSGPLHGVVRLHDGDHGAVTASLALEATGDASVAALAPGNGTLWLAARYAGDVTVSDIENSSIAGSADILLVERGPGLAALAGPTVRSIGGPGHDEPMAIMTLGTSLFVAGTYEETIVFPEPAVSIADAGASRDGFLIAYDTLGKTVKWARSMIETSDTGTVAPAALTALDNGVIVVGNMTGTVDFGLLEGPSQGEDAFVARYDLLGNVEWVVRFGGAGSQRATTCARDSDAIYVAGTFETELDFAPGEAGESLVAGAASDVWLAKIDAGGALVWMRSYGQKSEGPAGILRLAQDGALFLGGSYRGALDFGGPAGLVTTDHDDPFVAAFALP